MPYLSGSAIAILLLMQKSLNPDSADQREPTVKPPSRWRSTFDAFSIPNYRWFFVALCGNFAAMNIQMFIRGWLVYEITGSYEKLGWMTAAGGLVGLIAAPLGGVVADRVKQKKTVLQISGVANALITLYIAILISLGELEFFHLLLSSILQGIVMNTMMPARQAFTKDIVGIDKLTNAIALSTSGMNTARLLLPGLAGGMVAALGGGGGNIEPAQWVYFLMTGLYLWAVFILIMISVKDKPSHELPTGSVFNELKLGFSYVLNTPVIYMLLGFNFLMVFFSMTYFMLLPGFAKDVLLAGPDRLGLLISISGIGSLLGSLYIASYGNKGRAKALLYGGLLMGIALVFFSLSTHYWLSVALLTLVGFGQSARMSLSNVLIQSYVDDEFRGRVMSIYMLEMAFLSVSIYPISLLADYYGPQLAVGLSAGGLIILILLLFRVPAYRNLD
ncbi:MAG: MFS transporter [Gammaproteobacteria bacterium]|nr:MFS transporter [Gammaproteobacteria bacterium]